ncbi:MAG: DUF488 domain-containing protein [Rhodobacteraceae bacterium]|nr:DUF488 domain-containing protein [Paracoccaceae bacterium]
MDVRLNNNSQLAGFAKQDDLAWLVRKLCGVDYFHLPELAPTKELLQDHRKKQITWQNYEERFLHLMRVRRTESTLPRDIIDSGCFLCSEDQPHHCRRRLVAEYPRQHWGKIEVIHLGENSYALTESYLFGPACPGSFAPVPCPPGDHTKTAKSTAHYARVIPEARSISMHRKVAAPCQLPLGVRTAA